MTQVSLAAASCAIQQFNLAQKPAHSVTIRAPSARICKPSSTHGPTCRREPGDVFWRLSKRRLKVEPAKLADRFRKRPLW